MSANADSTDTSVLVHNKYGRRTPDQQALADIGEEVNRNARNGKFISYDEAKILDS